MFFGHVWFDLEQLFLMLFIVLHLLSLEFNFQRLQLDFMAVSHLLWLLLVMIFQVLGVHPELVYRKSVLLVLLLKGLNKVKAILVFTLDGGLGVH